MRSSLSFSFRSCACDAEEFYDVTVRQVGRDRVSEPTRKISAPSTAVRSETSDFV